MFPSFLSDSYFQRLMNRLDTMQQNQQDSAATLSDRIDTAQAAFSTALGRVADLEGLADAHNTRLAALEVWRGDKAPAVAKIDAAQNMSAVTLLGIQLVSAQNVKVIADKVDAVIECLRAREIIQT